MSNNAVRGDFAAIDFNRDICRSLPESYMFARHEAVDDAEHA